MDIRWLIKGLDSDSDESFGIGTVKEIVILFYTEEYINSVSVNDTFKHFLESKRFNKEVFTLDVVSSLSLSVLSLLPPKPIFKEVKILSNYLIFLQYDIEGFNMESALRDTFKRSGNYTYQEISVYVECPDAEDLRILFSFLLIK